VADCPPLATLKCGHFDGFEGKGFKIASLAALRRFEKYLKRTLERALLAFAAPGWKALDKHYFFWVPYPTFCLTIPNVYSNRRSDKIFSHLEN
jgi:hypothetical protein